MPDRNQVYKCEVCGVIIEVLHSSKGKLVCCGKPMTLMAENTVDAAKEKHVPVIEKDAGGIKVKVGEVAHPMEEKHYIEWIELVADGKVYRQFGQRTLMLSSPTILEPSSSIQVSTTGPDSIALNLNWM